MKKYWFLKGAEKIGPKSFDEIIALKLSPDVLVWHDELDNWKKYHELPEFNVGNKLPPPIPIQKQPDNIIVSSQPNLIYSQIRKPLMILFAWLGFCLIAYSTSTAGLEIANCMEYKDTGFWPFVEFTTTEKPYMLLFKNYSSDKKQTIYEAKRENPYENFTVFNGFFVGYEETELILYSVLGVLIFLIYSMSIIKTGKSS